MLKSITSVAIIALIFSGCGSNIGPIPSFEKVHLQKSSFMPSKEEVENPKIKIILSNIDNSSFNLAIDSNLGNSLSINIESELSGVVEVIDRNIAQKFDDEIRLNELQNESNNIDDGSLDLPEYAISGKISNSGIRKNYYSKSCSYNKDGSVNYCKPAFYSFKASVHGILKIHKVPSMKLLKTIRFGGTQSKTKLVQGNSFYAPRLSSSEINHLINKAGENAIHSSRVSLKNFFSPKGYIMEKRINEDDTIFKITLGSFNGLSQGSKVIIYNITKSINPLTNKIEKSTVKVAEGMVSNKIYKHQAWIILTEGYSKVKLGDFVKVIYKKTFLEDTIEVNSY